MGYKTVAIDNRVWVTCILLLLFLVVVPSGYCQCSGSTLVVAATTSYTQLTSLDYPQFYRNNMDCQWLLQVTNSTDVIKFEVLETSIEYHEDCEYDYLEAFDGTHFTADSLGVLCGTSTATYVSSGQYMLVRFISDYSLTAKGFKAQFMSGPRESLLNQMNSNTELNVVAIVGGAVGGFVFLVVVAGITYMCVKSAKAKRNRTQSLLRRPVPRGSNSRIQPMTYTGDSYNMYNYWGPYPPAYGEMFSSPTSPPPAYCEIDPNPNPNQDTITRQTDNYSTRHQRHSVITTRNSRPGSRIPHQIRGLNMNSHLPTPSHSENRVLPPYSIGNNNCTTLNVASVCTATAPPMNMGSTPQPINTTRIQVRRSSGCLAVADTNASSYTVHSVNLRSSENNIISGENERFAHPNAVRSRATNPGWNTDDITVPSQNLNGSSASFLAANSGPQ